MDEYESESSEIPDEEEQRNYAYADYLGVVQMIQTYYYRMVFLFQQYYNNYTKGRDMLATRQNIQAHIITLKLLLERYESIREEPKIMDIFNRLNLIIESGETLNYKGIVQCINTIRDAHHTLGLSKIELHKKDLGKSMLYSRGF